MGSSNKALEAVSTSCVFAQVKSFFLGANTDHTHFPKDDDPGHQKIQEPVISGTLDLYWQAVCTCPSEDTRGRSPHL